MAIKIPLHYEIADQVMEMVKEGTHRTSVQERLTNGTIEQIVVQEKSFQTIGEIFISSADIYSGLKINAIKLVIRIQQELFMNNPLWECTDKSKSEVRSGLAQLKAKGIIKPVGDTDIYVVNPAKIRKGKPLSVYGALYEYAKKMYLKDKSWKPTTKDIRRFKAPEKVTFSPYSKELMEGYDSQD